MKKTNWMVGRGRGWAGRLMVVALMVVALGQDGFGQTPIDWSGGNVTVSGSSNTYRFIGGATGTMSFQNNARNATINSDNVIEVENTNPIQITLARNNQPMAISWMASFANRGTGDAMRISSTGSEALTFGVVGGVIAATSGRAIQVADNQGSGAPRITISSGLVIAHGTAVDDVIRRGTGGTAPVFTFTAPDAFVVTYVANMSYACNDFIGRTGLLRHYSDGRPSDTVGISWEIRHIEGKGLVTGIRYGNNQFFGTPDVRFINHAAPDISAPTCNAPQRCSNCTAILKAIEPDAHVWGELQQLDEPTCYSPAGSAQFCIHHPTVHNPDNYSEGERLNCEIITWNTDGGQPPPIQSRVVTAGSPGGVYGEIQRNTVISEPAPMTKDRFNFVGWSSTGSTGPNVTFPIMDVTGPVTLHAKWEAVTSGLSLTNASGGAVLVNHVFPSAEVGYGAQTPLSVSIGNTGGLATGTITVPVLTGNASAFTVTRVAAGTGTNPQFTLNSVAAFGSIANAFTITPANNLPIGTYTATIAVNAADVDVANRTMTVSFTVTKASRTDIPTGIGTTNASIGGSDGALTGVNLSTMEWRRTGTSLWSSASPTGLAAGNYEVRFRETDTHFASSNVVTVTIGESVPKFTITVTPNPTAGGTASADPESAEAGEVITLSYSDNTGYTFSGWTVNSGGITIEEDNTFTMPSGNVSVTANFTPDNYNVTWNAAGGTPPPTQTTVNHGVNITEPEAMSKTGHTFGGWFTDALFVTPASFPITASGPMTFWANWTLNNYAVTWNVDGGTPAVPGQTTVDHGGEIAEPETMSKTGHTFGGWFSNSGLTIPAVVFPVEDVTEPTEFWAMWTINKYKVSFNSNGGTSVGDIDVDYNNMITAPSDPTLTGHTFDGWYRDAGLTNLWVFASNTVVSDTTLFAKWTPNKYTVTFNSNGGSAVDNITNVEHDRTIAAPPDPTKDGYTFGGWYMDNVTFEDEWVFTSNIVVSDTTLFAKWNPAPLTGTATINNMSPVYGQTLTGSLTGSTNNTGTLTYRWLVGGVQSGTGVTYPIQAADVGKTITLEIESSEQTGTIASLLPTAAVAKAPGPAAPTTPSLGQHVTVSSTNDGRIDGVSTSPMMEWRRTLPAADLTDWADVPGITIPSLIVGTYEVRYKATATHFESQSMAEPIVIAQNYAITVSVNTEVGGTGGTASANVISAIPGTTITLTASQTGGESASYDFKNWTGAGVTFVDANSMVTTFAMPSNAVTVAANFTPRPLTGTAAITGTPTVGQTLTASFAGNNNTGDLIYRWIAGEDTLGRDPTYVIKSSDVNRTITLQIRSTIQTGPCTIAATTAVAQMAVTITPTPGLNKVFGGVNPPLTFTNIPALLDGDEFSGSLSHEGVNAGSHPYIRGTLSAGSGYNLTVDAAARFTINKAAITSLADQPPIPVKYDDTSPQAVDLAALVETYKLQEDELDFNVQSYTDPSNILMTGAAATGGTLTFNLNSGLVYSSQTATIPVKITGFTNYSDVTVDIRISLTNKPVAVVTVTAPANITYGETLGEPSASVTTGGVSGTFTYNYTGTLLDAASTPYNDSAKPEEPGNYTVTATLDSYTHDGSATSALFTISQKTLAWNADGTVGDKDYDRTTAAAVSNHPTLNGVINSDAVTVKTGTAAFVSRVVNSAAGVTASGYDIEGAHAWKYNAPVSPPTFANAEIRPFELTITGVSATNRAWNVGTSVALTGGTLVGVFPLDALNVDFTLGNGSITSASVEDGKAVTTNIVLTGTENGNYTLIQPTYVTVNIFRADRAAPALDYSISATDFPKTITITLVEGAEYSFDGGANFSPTNTYTSHSAETVDLAIRFPETATHNESPEATALANTENQTPLPPAAFTLSYVVKTLDVDYTVTIPVTAGAEYKFDIDGAMAQDWSDVNTITALPGQTVKGYKRLAAKPGYNVSGSVEDEIALPLFIVEKPTATPNGGVHTTLSLTVTLSTTTVGAAIYYTLDGSTPAISDDDLYTGPFELTAPITATVKAIAVKDGMTDSDVMSVEFTINTPSYAVTWDVDGGTPVPQQTSVTHGDDIAAPEPMTKTGYIFDGWFSDEDFTDEVDFPIENVTAARAFWAKWTIDMSVKTLTGIKFLSPKSNSSGDVPPYQSINVENASSSYTVEIAAVDQHGAPFIGGEPVRIDLIIRIGNAVTTRILNTNAQGIAEFKVPLAGSVNGNEVRFTAIADIDNGEETVIARDTAHLLIVRTAPPADAPAAKSKNEESGMNHLTVLADESARVPAANPKNEEPEQLLTKFADGFAIGPNMAKKGEIVKIFRIGKSIGNGVLTVYDASGNPVSRINIRDNAFGNQDKRAVASWNLKDTKGRFVSEGTYIVRGTVVTSDGKREKISLMIGVR